MKKYTTIEKKAERIAELKKELKEIENAKFYNYALVEVIPDCGGGIRDRETILVVCEQQKPLVGFCVGEFGLSPSTDGKRPTDDNHKPCDTWYKIELTSIEIIQIIL